MRVVEGLPGLVAACGHEAEFERLERVHGDAADEGDVHAEAAVQPRALQTDEYAEFGGGLGGVDVLVGKDCSARGGKESAWH